MLPCIHKTTEREWTVFLDTLSRADFVYHNTFMLLLNDIGLGEVLRDRITANKSVGRKVPDSSPHSFGAKQEVALRARQGRNKFVSDSPTALTLMKLSPVKF